MRYMLDYKRSLIAEIQINTVSTNQIFQFVINVKKKKSHFPILLFCRYGSRDCGFAIEERQLDVFPEARQAAELCGDPNIEEYLQQAVQQNGLQQPQDWESASKLYLTLKNIAGF